MTNNGTEARFFLIFMMQSIKNALFRQANKGSSSHSSYICMPAGTSPVSHVLQSTNRSVPKRFRNPKSIELNQDV